MRLEFTCRKGLGNVLRKRLDDNRRAVQRVRELKRPYSTAPVEDLWEHYARQLQLQRNRVQQERRSEFQEAQLRAYIENYKKMQREAEGKLYALVLDG